jgi:hypothetical protein
MNTDFLDAHERHLDDADHLHASARFANADHLYGVAAECGLKRLMQAFGMPTGRRGPRRTEDRKHADEIWLRFGAYQSGHASSARYALPPSNPFSDWHIDQRYAHHSEFTAASVQPHATSARLVKGLIGQARRDGLL